MATVKTFAQQKKIYRIEDFIATIKQFHPLAKTANLEPEKAKANLTAAKGAFDPTIEVDYNNKTFDGKNYYQYYNPELKIPTPIGLDIKTGLESNTGKFISNELTSGNSSYLGIEANLAKGLLLDKRRASLKQAKILIQQSLQERNAAINDLLASAYISYYNWAGAYQLYSNYSKFITISEERLKLIRIAQKNGERSVADTIEAYTQYQNILLLQNESLIKLISANYELSSYLWKNNDSTYDLPSNFIPDTTGFLISSYIQNTDELVQQSNIANPNLLMYNFKLKNLEIEKKLKFQNFLPTLNAKFNLLNKEYNVLNKVENQFLENNNKWGLYFKMPIYFREAKADYKKVQLKIRETNFALQDKINQVNYKIKSYSNEALILKNQIEIITRAITNYNTLLKAETTRFFNGESSLFLVNSRETKLLEMQQKEIELRVKYYKAKYMALWAAGILQ